MNQEELDLIPTSALIDTLFRRFDITLFVGCQKTNEGWSQWFKSAKGCGPDMLGILRLVEFSLIREFVTGPDVSFEASDPGTDPPEPA